MTALSASSRHALLLCACAVSLMTPRIAQALPPSEPAPPFEELTDVGTLDQESVAYGVNNGRMVVGSSRSGAGLYEAYYWTPDGGIQGLSSLGGPTGSCASAANAVSANNVIVGYAAGGPNAFAAVRWVNTVIEELDPTFLGDSEATAVNANGRIITGFRNIAGQDEAFIWDENIGTFSALSGLEGIESRGYAISADGTVVGGWAKDAGHSLAFRWTDDDGADILGTLNNAAGSSAVYDMNATGSVLVGFSWNGAGYEAFRWTTDDGMEGLGLMGGTSSFAQAVSGDGAIITGFSMIGGDKEAFRWTESGGMRSLEDILAENDVDFTGWELREARAISADGRVIAGTGTFGGLDRAYLMAETALVTPEELARAVQPVAQAGQQSRAMTAQGLGQSMHVARNALPSYLSGGPETGVSGGSPGAGLRGAAYLIGGAGIGQQNDSSNHLFSGSTGLVFRAGDAAAIGFGVFGSRSKEDTYRGGETRTNAAGAAITASYEAAGGLRLYGTAMVAALDIETRRHYLNGAAVDSSRGATDGVAYGVAARAGYETGLSSRLSVMPYAEAEWSRARIDGYTETGGGIPAAVAEQRSDAVAGRLGAELSHQATDRLVLRAHAAWGHRFSDEDSVFVQTLGITQSVSADAGARDWAEGGAGLNYAATEDLVLSATVQGRAGRTSQPALFGTLGLAYRF